MLETLLLQGKNENTLLPRVLRIIAQQGKQIETLTCEVQKNRQLINIEITLQDKGDLALTAKLLQRLVAVETVASEKVKQTRAM
ncbi:MAG: hypothetical protein PHH31_08525 [Acidaminococcaceae bacterium]|nr:hypothetical protein [Acidaminococcaceae bacterium]MDD4721428.1 hypothetical protein [Acidaminococcaceae bacterium]